MKSVVPPCRTTPNAAVSQAPLPFPIRKDETSRPSFHAKGRPGLPEGQFRARTNPHQEERDT